MWFLYMTGLAVQDDGNIFHRNFSITARCCSAQTPQNCHFFFRIVRNQKPRLRYLMSVLLSLMKVHENQEGLKPNVTYQLVRCANENKHGIPITRELFVIKNKETSIQTFSILRILRFTQWVADDSAFLGHDFASMANGIPTFRESVVSSSSRVETSYIFHFRNQNPLDVHNFDMTPKLPLCARIHKHQLAWFRPCRSSDRIPELVTIYKAQFRILTYLLTPRSRALLVKLTGSAASQEIPRIFGTRRFITVITSARQLSLSSANSIQSPQPPPTS